MLRQSVTTVSSPYGQLFAASSNWLADAYTSIQNDNNAGGLLGMLRDARAGSDIKSFLGKSSSTAHAFAQDIAKPRHRRGAVLSRRQRHRINNRPM
jgi:hypothetical protein